MMYGVRRSWDFEVKAVGRHTHVDLYFFAFTNEKYTQVVASCAGTSH
jgi:hypothetical protein